MGPLERVDHRRDARFLPLTHEVEVQHALDGPRLQPVDDAPRLIGELRLAHGVERQRPVGKSTSASGAVLAPRRRAGVASMAWAPKI